MSELLEVRDVWKSFRQGGEGGRRRGERFFALRGVNLTISRGESVAVVGESGSGKSTLARIAMRLEEPDRGSVVFDGHDLLALKAKELRAIRPNFQMVFQDPYAAFDPIMPIGSSLEQPLIVQGDIPRQERRQKVADLFQLLGLSPEDGDRFPRSFSGGQLQRIAIGRAIITNPSLVVCDEPVASLDVSIRGQVLNLLLDLQRQHDVSFMFISHDLSVVRRFADRTVVMYAGQVLEERTTESLFRDPLHPYTRALLDAMPVADPLARRDEIPAAEKPSSSQPSLGVGCAYRHRCPFVMDECHSVTPELVMAHGSGSLVACHLYGPKRSEGSEAHEAHEAHERTVDVAHSGAAAVDEPGRQGE